METMRTEYYCESCNDFFEEGSIPNVNKLHTCGKVARVVRVEQATS
jgi:hypothetical protein